MKTSVVISTYNGEKYIIEQLESIRTQSVPVDEVLIFDDCSKDNTVEICINYIKMFHLIGWKIKRNEQNLGFVKNFIYGLYETSGDVIFLADQDDIWKYNKVELTVQIFKERKCLSLASTFSRIDIHNEIINRHVVHPHRKKNGLRQISLEEYCCFNGYLGMATAISRNLLNFYDLRNFCNIFNSHDIMINYVSVIQDGLYFFDYTLVNRRSYLESTSNKQNGNHIKDCNGNSLLFCCMTTISWYRSYIAINIENEIQNKIITKYIHLQNQRLIYLKSFSIKDFLKEYKLLFSKIKLRYVKDFIWILSKKC